MYGDLLQYCEPGWLDMLAKGTTYLRLGLLGFLLSMIGWSVLASILRVSYRDKRIVETMLTEGFGFVALIGCWRLTTPHPAPFPPPAGRIAASIARYSYATSIAIGLLGGTLMIQSLPLGALIHSCSTVAEAAAIIAMMRYARRLALRMPNPSLATATNAATWVLVGCIGITLFTLIVSFASAPNNQGRGFLDLPVAGALALLWLVLFIWCLVLLARFREAFRWAERVAMDSWAA